MNTLDAINTMLAHISQSPIATLSGSKTARVIMAENLLKNETRSVQLLSYDFNRIENYPLYANEDGEIILPENILKLDVCSHYLDGNRYIQRGKKLYNKTQNTFKINRTLEVNIITELPFEDLPEPAKNYVLMQACNKFIAQIKDDRNKYAYSQQEVFDAKQTLDEFEAESGNYNILNVYNDKRFLG